MRGEPRGASGHVAALSDDAGAETAEGPRSLSGKCWVTGPITPNSPYPLFPAQDWFPESIDQITAVAGSPSGQRLDLWPRRGSIERTASLPSGGRGDGLKKTLVIPLDGEDVVW